MSLERDQPMELGMTRLERWEERDRSEEMLMRLPRRVSAGQL